MATPVILFFSLQGDVELKRQCCSSFYEVDSQHQPFGQKDSCLLLKQKALVQFLNQSKGTQCSVKADTDIDIKALLSRYHDDVTVNNSLNLTSSLCRKF